MHHGPGVIAQAYDNIADLYDVQWSRHVRRPQLRLTRGLLLRPGMRCADLGCGTGVDTLDMAQESSNDMLVAIRYRQVAIPPAAQTGIHQK